jgi:hypothetical protein
VSKLACSVVTTTIKTAVHHNAASEACTDADIKQITNVRVLSLAVPYFSKR